MDQETVEVEVAPAEGSGLVPVPFDWKRHIARTFDVDFSEKGESLIYQFWPLDVDETFPGGNTPDGEPIFALAVERAFQAHLPADAQVKADYISVDEQMALARLDQRDQRLVRPHEADLPELTRPFKPTLYVEAVDVLKNPFAYQALTERLFAEIDKQVP